MNSVLRHFSQRELLVPGEAPSEPDGAVARQGAGPPNFIGRAYWEGEAPAEPALVSRFARRLALPKSYKGV